MDKRILIGAGVGLGILAAVVVAVLATRGPAGPVSRTPAVQRTTADAPAVSPRVTTRKRAVSSGSRATTSRPRTRSTSRTIAPGPARPAPDR